MPEDWRATLSNARRRLGLSRARLAQLAGLSEESVRAYELGRRRPTLHALDAIINALSLERVEANAIREAAGFRPVHSLFASEPGYTYSVEDLQTAVERYPWPVFAVNDSVELVAANRAACAVWQADFQVERLRRTPVELNLLAVATEFEFPRRVCNWDEIVEILVAIFKGRPVRSETLADPSPYLDQVLAHFARNDSGFLARLIDMWGRAEPLPPKVRWDYPVVWNDGDFGQMRFHGVVTTANEDLGLAFNDWIPLDAESWQVLERVKARGVTWTRADGK